MSPNGFKLDSSQFPRQKFGLSLQEYADDESRRKHVLYARQGILSAEQRPKDKLSSLRDVIRLPKASVVEQRDAVIKLITDGIEYHQNTFSYEIDRRLNEKLFNAPKYRDVTVGDLADLLRDIENKVEARPDNIGRTGFSNAQWKGILKATEEALAATDAGKKPRTEPGGGFTARRLMRACASLYDKTRVLASGAVKKHGAAVLIGVLFVPVVYAVPGALPVALAAVGGAAFTQYMMSTRRPKKSETVQIKELAALLVAGWEPEFAKKPDAALAPDRNLLLASDGARFSSDLRRDLSASGRLVNETVLSGAIKQAFETLSVKHANIRFAERERNVNEEKIRVDGAKYTSHGSDARIGDRVITNFSGEDGKKIILRRINQLPRENTALRLLNDRVMAQARILEHPPFGEPFKGRSLTGYLGMVKLKDGYIAQAYEDYRDWLTISDIRDILEWAIAAKDPKDRAKEQEWARNIENMLIADASELSGRFAATSVPPGSFAVDAEGHLRFSLEQWLDDDGPVDNYSLDPRTIDNAHADWEVVSSSSGSSGIEDDISVTDMSRTTGETTAGLTNALTAFRVLPQTGEQADKPVVNLQLTQSEKKIRDHLAALIKKYRAEQLGKARKAPVGRTIEGRDHTVKVSEPPNPAALPAPKKKSGLGKALGWVQKKLPGKPK